MEFRTKVNIPASDWTIEPCERMLFVGSCFADNMGRRFIDEKFRAVVNPYGVMYNPVSIVHTIKRLLDDAIMPFTASEQGTAVFTLGTNHVYIFKATNEIVDNCRKQPQSLFREEQLSVEECAKQLIEAIHLLSQHYPKVRYLLTVSPIRYRKYGYHGSQLSKATLLLAIDKAIGQLQKKGKDIQVAYFPSYEIVNDELRDYRFYKADMLHPTDQTVDYLFERLAEAYFSKSTLTFLKAWHPIREALGHRPFRPDSEDYQRFRQQTEENLKALKQLYPDMP